MKKNNILVALVLLMMPVLAGAQALKGSYFLDNSLNRHEMNPAFAPRANYFQAAAIGNMGFGLMSNIDMPSLLYPKDGKLLTFLHPDVSMAQFDKAFPEHPHLDMDYNATLFGFGFYTKRKSFWTFDIDMRMNFDTDLPGDLFRFMKAGTGTEGRVYNVGNLNAYAMAGVQASLGYSRIIFKGFRAGVKARVIAPMAYAALNLEQISLATSPEQWTLTTEGYAHVALQGLDISLPQGEMMPAVEFDLDRMINNKVLAGLGYSFDLGVEWTLDYGTFLDGLSVSAAVTDLGRVRYNGDAVSSFKTGGSVPWTGFSNIGLENNDLEASLNEFVENAKKELVNLEEMNHEGNFTRSTMPRFYAGVEVPFFKRKMSVGLLYSARKSHSYLREEMTVSCNLTPCKWFALGVNYSFLNTAKTMGFILELTPRVGPAFYIGCDYIPVSFAPAEFVPVVKMLPMAMRTNINFGIAFHTGGKTTKNPKKVKKSNINNDQD